LPQPPKLLEAKHHGFNKEQARCNQEQGPPVAQEDECCAAQGRECRTSEARWANRLLSKENQHRTREPKHIQSSDDETTNGVKRNLDIVLARRDYEHD
jgi:hypothetical protein